MNYLNRLLLVGGSAAPGTALWVALSLLTGCAGLGLEMSVPLVRRPAAGRTRPPDTLRGQVLHLPVVVVRASVRGVVDQFACYAGKRAAWWARSEQVGPAAVGTGHAGQVLVRLGKTVPRPVPAQTWVVLTLLGDGGKK